MQEKMERRLGGIINCSKSCVQVWEIARMKASNSFALVMKSKAKRVVSSQQRWYEVLKSQIETGTPYMLFKIMLFK
ncbi:uncharacterized protein LOC133728527 [Rosa rugosa]|uniref:uncharacterized protein LOC133728527 n=1 Tax=Rosa rugosa TaxID=74645 RepID=UPI002B400912|nr:uncharacterized protein LOC133728527 [Rosa rugosa]